MKKKKRNKNTNSRIRGPSRKIDFQHTGKDETVNAGVVPPIKFLNETVELDDLVEEHVPLERDSTAVYQIGDVILLAVIGIMAGGDNITQILNVWRDSVLLKVAGWLCIPDDSTFGRIIREMEQKHIEGMENLVHAARAKIWARAKEMGHFRMATNKPRWIDIDSTVITVYGHQEGAKKGYNPHKRGANSYHPLLAFDPETKEILQGELRNGNVASSSGVIGFIKRLFSHFSPLQSFIIRADKGFYCGEFMSFLEGLGQGFLIKAKLTQPLLRMLAQQTWTPVPYQKGWEQCEFFYKAQGWTEMRRFVAVRQLKGKTKKSQGELIESQEYDFFAYVTTESISPWEGHKRYGERATSETWIDEAKNQMGLGHIRTAKFLANSTMFQCAILAYNTMRWMALLSPVKEVWYWEVATMRRVLIQVVGKLISSGRRLCLRVPKNHLHPAAWRAWLALGSS